MKAMPQNTTKTAGRTPVLLLSVIVIACFSSCNNNKRKDDAAKIIRHPVFIDKGFPSYNPGIWTLFKKIILKRENKEMPLQKGGTE